MLACYSPAFFPLAWVLQSGVPVAVAYATWSAIGLTATAALSANLFDEKLSARQVVALAVIVGGVVVLEAPGPQ
ncbi:DMT family transporter [Gordonia humi]|uniref:DMT family transporter n=1 Tax=Gordonia humi TaxID=686429 RepID=UPI00160E7887